MRAILSDNDTYLGDGAYLHITDHNFCLYTSDGIEVTNQVWLQPEYLDLIIAKLRRKT